MTSIRTEALAHQHAVNRSQSFNACLRKYRAANTLAVMMVCVCGMVLAVAVVEADRVLKREAAINQEQIAWAK